MGVEPIPPFEERILSPLRLPFRHARHLHKAMVTGIASRRKDALLASRGELGSQPCLDVGRFHVAGTPAQKMPVAHHGAQYLHS